MLYNINIANPNYLYGFIILPILIILYLFYIKYKNKAFEKFGDTYVIISLYPDYSKQRQLIKFTIICLSIILIITAMIDPLVGTKLGTTKYKGADIMIALDVSKSMLAEDIKPNRLERAKQALSKFTDELEGYKIGLVVFAGRAYPKLPLTPDMAAAKNMIESADVDQLPTQGTAIGEAIEICIRSLSPSKSKDKAIILISDGENHEDDAISAAKLASEENIKIFTLGIGSLQGAPIPIYEKGIRKDFKKDLQGNTVITKLNEELLERIAVTADGMYVRANNINESLHTVIKEIKKIQGKEYEAKWFSEYEDKYQYPLAIAIILLIIETLIPTKKGIIEKLNIFSEDKKL
ncbi:MAG TPA: VWA domain-containing protein [Bacteroidales bacterium]|nr:VWA domain-containing protein [Bacteroidales bacterium]